MKNRAGDLAQCKSSVSEKNNEDLKTELDSGMEKRIQITKQMTTANECLEELYLFNNEVTHN